MKKMIIPILGLVGFISAIITLTQAYSFVHLPKVEGHYYHSDLDNNSVFEFLFDVRANVGNVVMLDFQMYVGREIVGRGNERHPFRRRTEGKSVGWYFHPCSFADEVGRQCAFTSKEWEGSARVYWRETANMLEEKFSNGRISWNELDAITPDNGLTVLIEGSGQNTNPFSSFEMNTEASDIASGPFQISMSNRDANFILRLSPAPFTDGLSAQVRCAKRDWPYAVKFLLCPFV